MVVGPVLPSFRSSTRWPNVPVVRTTRYRSPPRGSTLPSRRWRRQTRAPGAKWKSVVGCSALAARRSSSRWTSRSLRVRR